VIGRRIGFALITPGPFGLRDIGSRSQITTDGSHICPRSGQHDGPLVPRPNDDLPLRLDGPTHALEVRLPTRPHMNFTGLFDRARLSVCSQVPIGRYRCCDVNHLDAWPYRLTSCTCARDADHDRLHGRAPASGAPQASHIALLGVVTGGGVRQDGPGLLGVWLYCNPVDFGVEPILPPPSSALRSDHAHRSHRGSANGRRG
jgi:hypothetical protein